MGGDAGEDIQVLDAEVLEDAEEQEEQKGKGLCISIATLVLSIPALIGA